MLPNAPSSTGLNKPAMSARLFPDLSIINKMNGSYRRLPRRDRTEAAAIDYHRSSAIPHRAWLDRIARNGVAVADVASVARFVERFPNAAGPVEGALEKARQYFPDAARLVLEILEERDGASDPDRQTLLITIEMNTSATDATNALDRLDRFDEAWWYDLPTEMSIRLGSYLRFI